MAAWYDRLQSLFGSYKATQIWNADETACFYRALPDKTLATKGRACKGGRKAKDRLTILLCANAAGDKRSPLVIGRAEKPRCFKSLKDKKHPAGVPYKANTKAWMTREMWTKWLSKWDSELAAKGEKILLLVDNATAHDPTLNSKLSNITQVFLPKNSTSRLQPLDAGVIKNFKVKYRQLLLRHVLALIDSSTLAASAIARAVDVLTAIRWIRQAWNDVKPSTIVNCFAHCGAVPIEDDTVDPFAELLEEESEESSALQTLVSQIDPTVFGMEYVRSDDKVATCATIDESDWRKSLLSLAVEKITTKRIHSDDEQINDEDSDDEVEEIEKCAIISYSQAISVAQQLVQFADERGDEVVGSAAFNLATKQKESKLKCSRVQTTVTEYFTKLH